MQPGAFELRCFAFKEKSGQWVAMCVDLSLAAQADSLKEVKASLNSQIESYLEDLNGIDREHVSDLFPRRAPFRVMALYYYACFRIWMSRTFGRADAKGAAYKFHPMHCPT